MKNWLNANEYQPRKMHTLNKIIVNHSVKFYSKAWKNRNKVRHNPIKYKEFVKDWYQKVVEMVENDNRPELNKYVRMQQIDVNQCNAAYVILWIREVFKLRKKTTKEVVNDIRRYMRVE